MNSKKKNKQILVIILIVLVLSFAFVVMLINKDKTKTYNNLNKDVISNKEVQNILFQNIRYAYNGSETRILVDIINNNNKSVRIGDFTINIFDKNNKLMDSFDSFYYEIIEPKGIVTNLQISKEADLSNANSIKFEIVELEFIE